MWGLYGLIYTAMGVAHALQGPRKKWKPRIILLTVALGLTATSHVLAAIVGFVAGMAFFFYLAERRRAYVAQIMVYAALGALVMVFAGFSFKLTAFLYVFTGGSARCWFALDAMRRFATSPVNAGIVVATAVAMVVYVWSRRSRYFGNTAPLLMLLLLFPLYTTQVVSAPWVWALPFLFTFVGGVFADVLDRPSADVRAAVVARMGRERKMFLVLTAGVVVTQAVLCWVWMAGLLHQ
jgi:hypothetical protein